MSTDSSHRWRWLAFAAALAATLMDLLDSTIANVAAPAIRDDLGGSYADLQWIAAAYTLAMAVMLLTGGRLGDMFGRKRMLLIGAAGFTLASIACAVAPSVESLIAFRASQGGVGGRGLGGRRLGHGVPPPRRKGANHFLAGDGMGTGWGTVSPPRRGLSSA